MVLFASNIPDMSSEASRSGSPVRLGVAGLGTVAQAVYFPLIARRPALWRIAAVCDASATVLERIGDRLALDASARHIHLDGMLNAKGIDAVLLLTSGSHGAAARAVLDAGLFLLCEKPLAFTLAEADGLEQDERLQLGYMKVFDPAVERACEIAGSLGALRSAEVTVLHPSEDRQLAHLGPLVRPSATESLPSYDDLIRQALGDSAPALGALYCGVLLGSIVHDLAVLDALVGGLTVVDRATTWPWDIFPGSVELEGPIGERGRASIRWHFLPDRPSYREEVSLHFDDGSLSIVFPSPYWMDAPTTLGVAERDGPAGERVTYHRSPEVSFDRQLLAFHTLVTTGGRPPVGAAMGRRHIELCQRAAVLIGEARGVTVGGEAGRPRERHA
jgi:myo-inositol 2-dehydrogenase/D-chiro-inositol 1-dehydrogenase